VSAERPSVLVSGNACLTTNVRRSDDPADAPSGLQAHTTVGCMGAGKALNLARLGLAVTLHTALGHDQPGRRVEEFLRRGQVQLIVDVDPAGTNTHVNLMDAGGGRTGVGIIAPSPAPPVDLERLPPVVEAADVAVLNPHGVCRPLLPIVRERHGQVWCDLGDYRPDDPHCTDFAEAATHVTMSGLHIPEPELVLQAMMAAGKELAVITYGAGGSIAATADGRTIRTPAITDLPQRDANGAGDSFLAGLLAARLSGHSLEQSLRMATIVAAMTVASADLVSADLSLPRVRQEYRQRSAAGQ
jgi:sugar/nucleoside kinase (ribokinase family)